MANYLNRPSIFEIATAFENGNNGEIKREGDGIYKTYTSLSKDEKSFVFRHPVIASKFNANSKKSKKNWTRIRGNK